MKLDLSEILAHVGMRYEYAVDEPPMVDEDLELSTRVAGQMVFANTGSILLLNGVLRTRLVLQCSRCLAYFELDVSVPVEEAFDLEMRPLGPRGRHTNVVIEEDENPDAGKLFDGPVFDLTELIRQNVTLAAPSQPLHDEECKGMCPTCGANLNESPCNCEATAANYALRGLKDLLKEY